MKNLPYKILSFLLAFMFWLFIQGSERQEINRKIEIRLKVPDGLILRGGSVRYKDATLSGSRSLLSDFSDSPLIAEITLPRQPLGKIRFRVDKEFIQDWNPKIGLIIHDAYLNLFLDEKMTKGVPVKETLLGFPEEGFVIEKISLDPKLIVVTGLKTELVGLKEVVLKPIDVTGFSKTQAIMAKIVIPPQLSSSTIFSKPESRVTVSIKQKKE